MAESSFVMAGARKVVIVDDDPLILERWALHLAETYTNLDVWTFNDPMKALPHLTPDIHLLLLDLEMPEIDGAKLLEYAANNGVRRNRTVIISSRDAKHLHDLFPHGSCLAVINKDDPQQQDALSHILDSVMRRQT